MSTDWVVHLLTNDHHAELVASGSAVEPGPGGFVHLSSPAQVAIPANLFYDGPELMLMWFRPEVLGAAVVWEAGDPPTPGMLFPHLYGALDLTLASATTIYRREDAGRFGEPTLPT